MLAQKTTRTIETINTYEQKWKIATNKTKFQLLHISTSKPAEIWVGNTQLRKQENIKILGLTLGRRGLQTHTNNRKHLAEKTLNSLRRFRNLNTNIFLRLYKVLVRPLLEYIPITTITLKPTQLHKLQIIQNKALRLATHSIPPYLNTIEELHKQHQLEPINTRIYRLANRTWDRMSSTTPHIVEQSHELDTEHGHDHNWWPRISPRVNGPTPEPKYIQQ